MHFKLKENFKFYLVSTIILILIYLVIPLLLYLSPDPTDLFGAQLLFLVYLWPITSVITGLVFGVKNHNIIFLLIITLLSTTITYFTKPTYPYYFVLIQILIQFIFYFIVWIIKNFFNFIRK